MKNANASSESQSVEFPELLLLSPDEKARLQALDGVIAQVGPAARDFGHLIKEVESRRLSDEELSEIFEERANGVAVKQAALMDKLHRRLPFGIPDIIPSSISYFERF